ncbi:hypothetical protein FDECE_14498 [Fusarium decemcellulare]|nr:hypothetical protein FDECE_14498 [Fusarium decemcellulare]
MASPNGKGSSTSRRSSARRSRSLRLSTGSGATNDDYDLSAMMVADGFRPTENIAASSSAHSTSHPQPEPLLPSSDPQAHQNTPIESSQPPAPASHAHAHSSEITTAMRIRPSSISKPPRNHDSLALRNEGTSAAGRPHARNVPSLSSDSPVIRAESPYTGPSGPSHPYQMYPQRTMSVATTSTAAAAAVIPEDRSYAGPRGPTHPYALYPQTTSSGESGDSSIPVGFNGMGAGYQRQIGPDGEEAGDLIGPMGHMEELPPYTRYPDNAYVPKSNTQTPTTEPSSPDRDIPGAGGIGMATRDPEFSSTDDDLALPRTRPSVRSNVSENSHHDINTAAVEVAEKPTVNKWQRRAKKKLWGIVPYWAICLLTVGLIVMGIIMGAVIGTIVSRNNGPHGPPPDDEYYKADPTTTTMEPEPMTTIPSDLPPMATGRFALPNIDPSQTTRSCFNDSTQQNAWTCEITFPLWSIDIKEVRSPENISYELRLEANDTNVKFPWGTQPPSILKPRSMILVNDTFESARGPAWWLRTTYDKTVIVSEKKLGQLSKGKRGWDDDDYDDDDDDDDNNSSNNPGGYVPFGNHQFKKQPINAQVGEKPWKCTWPNTVLEIFIYPHENASVPSYAPSSTKNGEPSSTASSSYSYPSEFDNLLAPYPRVFKMLERRIFWGEESVTKCHQFEVIGDGSECRDVLKDGKPVEITIVESSDSVTTEFEERSISRVSKRQDPRRLVERASLELTDCGCLWMST